MIIIFLKKSTGFLRLLSRIQIGLQRNISRKELDDESRIYAHIVVLK